MLSRTPLAPAAKVNSEQDLANTISSRCTPKVGYIFPLLQQFLLTPISFISGFPPCHKRRFGNQRRHPSSNFGSASGLKNTLNFFVPPHIFPFARGNHECTLWPVESFRLVCCGVERYHNTSNTGWISAHSIPRPCLDSCVVPGSMREGRT